MRIRVTGIVIEEDQLLVLDQDTDDERSWSLPGGKVEPGETLEEALVREMAEETGAVVSPLRMLYVCDHVKADVLHITFEARRIGGELGAVAKGADTRPIRRVTFMDLARLPELGFSEKWMKLCQEGFPDAGSYMGPKSAIGL